MGDAINGTGPIPNVLRAWLRDIIGAADHQLLSDFDVDPDLLRRDVDYGAALDALIDHVVQSVRLFDSTKEGN